MKPLTLVSVITENYLPHAMPFLDSLQRVKRAECVCVCLDFIPALSVRHGNPHVRFVSMPTHWSADNGIFQHGRFLDAIPDVQDDRLYLLSDADIVIQRDFTEAEIVRFTDYDKGTFGAGWNAFEGDSLALEAVRMSMQHDPSFGTSESIAAIPCYNTGVLCMRGHAWKRLRDLYESRVRGFWKINPHRSRTQWLVCWAINRLGMKVDVLGPELHAHGHHPIPAEVMIRDGVARYRDEVVMFRHAF